MRATCCCCWRQSCRACCRSHKSSGQLLGSEHKSAGLYELVLTRVGAAQNSCNNYPTLLSALPARPFQRARYNCKCNQLAKARIARANPGQRKRRDERREREKGTCVLMARNNRKSFPSFRSRFHRSVAWPHSCAFCWPFAVAVLVCVSRVASVQSEVYFAMRLIPLFIGNLFCLATTIAVRRAFRAP